MFELVLVGIGTGNPDHVTFEAAEAIRTADVILIPRKGADKADLADLRRQICTRIAGPDTRRITEFDLPRREDAADYCDSVDAWHDAVAAAWQAAIMSHGGPPASAAFLIWGDPSLYDSSLRIAARLRPLPQIRVVPGITALQALTAAHRIPLNEVGEPVLVTTGRKLRQHGWPASADTVAVMLDGTCAFRTLSGPGFHIWWGACLGMPEQLLFHGRLEDVGQSIVEARRAARARHGWIMDTYILRRERSSGNNLE